MAITMEVTINQVARVIEQMTPGELETLAILLDPDLRRELTERRGRLIRERREGQLLSEDELFEE